MVNLVVRASIFLFAITYAQSFAHAQQPFPAHNVGPSGVQNMTSLNFNDDGANAVDNADGAEAELDLDSLLDADVSQLRNTQVAPSLQMEVSSVSRQKSTIGKSPAAVFVVTQEMIRRSGYRTVPDLLRLVPGLHVAKIGASKWSVSSRGFVNVYNQQLLVQIDGRSVYTPIFGGVVWNWHDMLLDDIERIEVIRGPGSTVWGANAVNGVINIISKKASDTTGILIEGGGGTEERAFAGFRIGGSEANGVDWRISSKWYERDKGFHPMGLEHDRSEQARINTRMDWESDYGDSFTLQGGIFEGTNGIAQTSPYIPLVVNRTPVAGGNMLFRWTRKHSEDSDSSLQLWADHYDTGNNRDYIIGKQTTFDFDFQHRQKLAGRHSVIWGLGYRTVRDDLRVSPGLPILSFNPSRRTAHNVSGFVQDEIELCTDKLFFTIGTKLSENSYTGMEVQPSARLLWAIDERSVAWTAFSRAVRVPTRTDSDMTLVIIPGFLNAIGNPAIEAEPLLAYEVGYRKQPTKQFSWDATLFYHDYNDMITFNLINATTFQANNLQDRTGFGAEISSQLDLTPNWKIRSWYSYLRQDSRYVFPGTEPSASPRHQAFLMSSMKLSECRDLDFIVRYTDDIRGQDIGAFIQADLRYAWRPTPNLEVSIVGQNLLNSNVEESIGSSFVPDAATYTERGVFGMLQYKY